MSGEELASDPDPDRPGFLGRLPWLTRLVGALAVVVAAVVVGPDLVSSGGAPPADRQATRTSGVPESSTPSPALSWPVRGALAKDTRFLEAVRVRARAAIGHPRSRRVIYAGLLPDGSKVGLVLTDRRQDQPPDLMPVDVVAVLVPAGGDVSQAPVLRSARLSDELLAAWSGRGSDGHVYAVMVSRPRLLRAQVSAMVSYRPDGSARRSWREVSGSDGTAVVDLGRRTDPSLFVRTPTDAGSLPVEVPVGARQRPQDLAALEVHGIAETGYRGPGRDQLLAALLETCAPLMDLSQVDVRVLWSGSLETFEQTALLRVRRADGPAFQVLVGIGSDRQLLSLGPLRLRWKVADTLPWLFDAGDPSRPMTLINPSGAGTATVGPPGEPPRRVVFGRDGLGQLGVGAPATPILFNVFVDVRRPDGSRVVRDLLTGPSAQDMLVLDL